MRALLPLLAALAVAAGRAAPAPPPLLLVLRAACDNSLHTVFDEARLLTYAPVRALYKRRAVRLLTYEGEKVRTFIANLSSSPSVLSINIVRRIQRRAEPTGGCR